MSEIFLFSGVTKVELADFSPLVGISSLDTLDHWESTLPRSGLKKVPRLSDPVGAPFYAPVGAHFKTPGHLFVPQAGHLLVPPGHVFVSRARHWNGAVPRSGHDKVTQSGHLFGLLLYAIKSIQQIKQVSLLNIKNIYSVEYNI